MAGAMELAKQIWDDTLRKFNPKPGWIITYACISDTWKSKLNLEIIKEIKKYGKSLGYKVIIEQDKFNWLIIKK